jgi:hypothetical protein
VERVETCAICGQPDAADRLIGWYVGTERRAVHIECWLRAHRERREEKT